jgi:hypothetical protein
VSALARRPGSGRPVRLHYSAIPALVEGAYNAARPAGSRAYAELSSLEKRAAVAHLARKVGAQHTLVQSLKVGENRRFP